MAEQVKPERKKLTITAVNEVQNVGKNNTPKLVFKANDGQHELQYYVLGNTALFPFIKKDTSIEADVETSQRPNTNDPEHPWIDRKVTMIYQDGKPIAESKGGWSSGKGGGYSIEAEKLKQESTAASYVKDIWLAGKISDTDSLVTALRHWLGEKLGLKAETPGKGQPAPAKTSESQPAKPSKATNDDDLFGDTPKLDTVKLLADFKKLPAATRTGLVKLYGITSWEHWDEVILALPADKQQALMKAVYEKVTPEKG